MPKINYGYCGAGFRVSRITYIGARRMIVYSRVRILSVHVAEIMSHIESGIVSVTTVSQGVGRPVIVGITFMTASTIKRADAIFRVWFEIRPHIICMPYRT